MALDNISDEDLSRAISNAIEGYPVQFLSYDGPVSLTIPEMKAELAVRKLNKEVNTMVRYYDKTYIESLRHGMAFTSASNAMLNNHTQTAFTAKILGSVGGTVWTPIEHLPESVGNRMVEYHETFLDKVYKFFDKFSIKFTTGVRDERVEQPSEDSNAKNVCKEG